MRELKVGIIGFGNMGAHLGLALSHATGGLVTVDGVVDPDDEKYRRNCEFIGNRPRRCATIAELREMPLDGIIVASPNRCHLENIQELQGLSTPLLLEKPTIVTRVGIGWELEQADVAEVVVPDDADAFTTGLRRVLEMGPQIRARLPKGKSFVIENFDVHRISKQILDVATADKENN